MVLTAHKLLILQTATTTKKATLPDLLYVYCTKMQKLTALPSRNGALLGMSSACRKTLKAREA